MGSPRPSYKELKSQSRNRLEVESRKVEGRKVAKSQGRKVAKSQGRRSIANVAISKFTKVEILETMGENCILFISIISTILYTWRHNNKVKKQ